MSRITAAVCTLASLAALCGCGDHASILQPSLNDTASVLKGNVHGGQQPVTGARIYLFAAGSSGYGAASVSLLNSSVTGLSDATGAYVLTDSAGNFNLTGAYTCTSGAQLYLFAQGGNPGAGVNTAASFLSAVGTCPAAGVLLPSTFLWMNEVTTAAMAFALAGFATDATHIGAPSSALAQLNLANAFATVPNLVDSASGVANTQNKAGTATAPQSKLNTIANVLTACVNSAGPSSTSCTTLLGTALANGSTGAQPTEVSTAAINMAHFPQNSVTPLFNLTTGNAAFAPALSTAPADFALPMIFSPQSGIQQLCIDGSGNVWISVFSGVVEIANAGNILSPAGGSFNTGQSTTRSLTIDPNNTIWTGGNLGNTFALSALTQSGALQSGSPYTVGTLGTTFYPYADGLNNIWVTNFNGGSVAKVNSSGVTLATYTSGFTSPVFGTPDASGNMWIANSVGGAMSKLSPTGVPFTSTGYPTGLTGLFYPVTDATGGTWVGSSTQPTAVRLNPDGTVAATATVPTGGAALIAMDGANTAWVMGQTGSVLSHVSAAGTLLSGAGFTSGNALGASRAVGVDGSGNVWTAGNSAVIEWIGLATPVVTPIAAAAKINKIAARP